MPAELEYKNRLVADKLDRLMKLYNSLSRSIEEFNPRGEKVGLYTCGPTVYDYAHIGHGRKYVNDDLLKRVLIWLDYQVEHVMNITDVGHLVSDADEGEDKLEKGAKKTGKTVWEVAEFYTEDFKQMSESLNIVPADVLCKATDHVKEMIAMVEKLIANGFAYDTPEAVYFEVAKFPEYNKLFGQDLAEKQIAVRADVKTGEHKRNPADFALWFKRVGRFADHTMHWDSPWGDGFPGWHIECSAMSMKYLGEQFDIHTGGEDHKSIHHPNEIAQAEGASGKSPFVKYWVHHAFLKVEGQKMSKSKGNYLRLQDIVDKGYDPLALRYLFETVHYRKVLNFTWEGLDAASTALNKLRGSYLRYQQARERTELSPDKLAKVEEYQAKFRASLEDDLNLPQAIAVVWEMIKSNIPDYDKYDLLREFDRVLGFDLANFQPPATAPEEQLPEEIKQLAEQRAQARAGGDFKRADQLRDQLTEAGYQVEDSPQGQRLLKNPV